MSEQTALFEDAAAALTSTPPDPEPTVQPKRELRDPRRIAFFVVGRGAAALLRSAFDGRRLTAARGIYDALAELSNEARSSEFRRARADVAQYAGVSDRTLDFYTREFERLGLLEVVRPCGGHAPNLWRLLQVDGDARGEANDTPGESRGEANDIPRPARGEANDTPGAAPIGLKKNVKEGNVIPLKRRESVPAETSDFSRFDKALRR